MSSELLLRDDPDIPDTEHLYRGIVSFFIKPSGAPSSSAFKTKHREHVSVDRASLTTPCESLKRLPKSVGLARLRAGSAREVTLGVASAPSAGNRAHALIIRDPALGASRWTEVARRLAESCEWEVRPPLRDDSPASG